MRALFIGGQIDNSELELDPGEPPVHYPPNTGSGATRYRLQQIGRVDGEISYVVYAAPELPEDEIRRVAGERDYARRFSAEVEDLAA